MTERRDRRGFTLVEAAIVVVVIALILTFTIPWMREQHEEQERHRLQALVDTEPWEVFEFQVVQPDRIFRRGEKVEFVCRLRNRTEYTLSFQPLLVNWSVWVTFGDSDRQSWMNDEESERYYGDEWPRYRDSGSVWGAYLGSNETDSHYGSPRLLKPGETAHFTMRTGTPRYFGADVVNMRLDFRPDIKSPIGKLRSNFFRVELEPQIIPPGVTPSPYN
jgi:prepilin-type N-terminal cleavage/methylation domain-containing protein